MARPTKLTPELHGKVVDAVRAGNYIETAAAYAGITKDTLYLWLKRGARSEKGPFREFSDAVKKAMAGAEVRDVALIGEAAKTQWQAAAWRLERKYPARWGQRVRLTVEQEQTVFLDRLEKNLPADIFEQVLAAGIDDGAVSTLPEGEGDSKE